MLAFVGILNGLVRVFVECDASLAEVNPLVVSPDGKLWAIDAKLNIDDNALDRRPSLEQLRDADAEEPAEARARAAGIRLHQARRRYRLHGQRRRTGDGHHGRGETLRRGSRRTSSTSAAAPAPIV